MLYSRAFLIYTSSMQMQVGSLPQSSLLALRPLQMTDAGLFGKWLADKEVVRYSLSIFTKLKSQLDVHEWLQNLLADQTGLKFGLVRKDTNSLIGYAGITDISKSNNSGEFFIFIGDKHSWGNGFGTEATRLIVWCGFALLDLNRIFLTVSEPNIGAIKAYERAGFMQEGVLREAAFRDGVYHNKIIMSILRREWDADC